MCGIVGIVNYNKNISNNYHIIRNMNNTLGNRGPDEDGYYFENNVNFGHKRLRWKTTNVCYFLWQYLYNRI